MGHNKDKVMKRAIIYCRVSTDEQAATGTSLDAQERESVAYCERAGLRVVRIFREDFTGTTLARPELAAARGMLDAGQAGAFVVHRPDRLDRSEWGINLLLLLQEFKALGVELHYSQQGRRIDLHNPIEALMQSIAGWQAGEDRNDTVKKLANGRRNRARQGYIVATGHQAPYGYSRIKDGLGRWIFEVDEVEAEVVKLVYSWYTSGERVTLRAIAKRLNKHGAPTRSGKPWGQRVVNGIIDNETYCGVWHFGKRGGPPDTWIPVTVPAIVDRATWQAAQQKKFKNKAEARRNLKGEYLLHRRVTCGCCGYKMGACYSIRPNGKIYSQRYSCQSRINGWTDCTFGSIPAGVVDAAVWNWLDNILSDKEARRRAVEECRAAALTQAGPVEQELALMVRNIAAAEASLARKMDDLEVLTTQRAKKLKNEEIEAIEAQLDALEREQANIQRRLNAARLTDEQLNSIDALMDQSAAGLVEARKSFANRQRLIEILDVTAKTLLAEDGKKTIKAFAVFNQIVGEPTHKQAQNLIIEGDLGLE